jgi:hypothetical protein
MVQMLNEGAEVIFILKRDHNGIQGRIVYQISGNLGQNTIEPHVCRSKTLPNLFLFCNFPAWRKPMSW